MVSYSRTTAPLAEASPSQAEPPPLTFLAHHPQVSILAHFLGKTFQHVPVTLNDAVFVGLDVEWYERGTCDITELGIAILDSKNIAVKYDVLSWIQCVKVFHVRIKENAHMLNTELCPGRPDKFHFGKTKFVTREEARRLLHGAFDWRTDIGSLHPVGFIGHGVDNDLEQLKQHLGVDRAGMGYVKATIDTQIMAVEIGIKSSGPLISLRSLLECFNINEEYLHTAGNDVAYTMIAGFLTAQFHKAHFKLDATIIQACIQSLKVEAYHEPKTDWGTEVFCIRCDAEDHLVLNCRANVHCDKCARVPSRAKDAATHKTRKCLVKDMEVCVRLPVVVPCELCIISTNRNRWSRANTHVTSSCAWEKVLKIRNRMLAVY